MLPVLLKDCYKIGHKHQYPSDTLLVSSNLTPRSSHVKGATHVVWAGEQYLRKEYLLAQFNRNFFQQKREEVMRVYKRRVDNMLGPGTKIDHIGELHELGYLPLLIKALPEGTRVPLRVPTMTIRNTDFGKFFWLTNMLETLISCTIWPISTSATTAAAFRATFEAFAKATGADPAFIQWQGHDFSMRGMMGVEAAAMSDFGHLCSFAGTDTIPGVDFAEIYYNANSDKELVGGSVPATEHSVMCMGLQDGEFKTFERLITETYPEGIVSIVSDTWDFWKVLTEYVPQLKDKILARNGKVVFRPDSGDPVKILCGDPDSSIPWKQKGAVEVLWDIFGGTRTDLEFKVLDPHVGLIYGDSINLERQKQILWNLFRNGFASSNIVLGIGSYTYQHVTRDTYGWAMKATYGETKSGGPQAIFKKPATDDGVKNSAKGLLKVVQGKDDLELVENVSWLDEGTGLLRPTFLNGSSLREESLAGIRKRLWPDWQI
jgi:nicotinamide phosphoribosyltransferase